MKKLSRYLCLLVALSLTHNKTYSQPTEPDTDDYDYYEWGYIKTPKGSTLEATTFYGEPPEWRAYYTEYGDYYVDLYNWTSCTRLDSGTTEYNCHAFAWYVSEGGSNVWLNPLTSSDGPFGIGNNPNLEKMITDGSYEQVYDLEDYDEVGVKLIYYHEGKNKHSAITTSDTALVRSKWAKFPLYEHKKHECLYYYPEPDSLFHSEFLYYKLNPTMTGSTSILCNNVQRTFSTDITDMPGAEFTWDTGDYLTTISGGGEDDYFINVRGNGNGDTYVNMEFTTLTGFSWSVDNPFYAGKPVLDSISGPNPYPVDKGCIGQPYTFWTSPSRNANSESTYQWMVYGGDYDFQYLYQDWATVIFYDQSDYYYVIARAYNTCGYTTWEDKNMQIINCGYFMIYPNPASDIVTIDFIGPVEDLINHKKPSDLTVQILDYSGILYYSANKSGDSFTIPVSNLKDGSYLIIIKYDGKAESLPLIKH